MIPHSASLFLPQFISCPVCSAGKSHRSGFQLGLCARLPGEKLRAHSCNHEFSLYDALKVDISGGSLAILGVFANWLHGSNATVESGKISRTKLTVAFGMSPFAILLTPYASKDHPDLHIVPSAIGFVDDDLLIAAPGAANADAKSLGVPIELSVFVCAYVSLDAPGWKRLLYDSLKDFSERRNSLSIFKLATSIELYADLVFEKYLYKKCLPSTLADKIRRSARNWPNRADRVREIAASLLTPSEAEIFGDALPGYENLVRKPRNLFAHEHVVEATHKVTTAAYEAAFDVLWIINRLDQVLEAS